MKRSLLIEQTCSVEDTPKGFYGTVRLGPFKDYQNARNAADTMQHALCESIEASGAMPVEPAVVNLHPVK